MTTVTIRMGDYPDGFDQARMLIARMEGMSMVAASGEFEDTYTVMLETDQGTLPVEVAAASFVAIASHCANVRRRKPLIVLQRYTIEQPFGFLAFVDEAEVARFESRLEKDR